MKNEAINRNEQNGASQMARYTKTEIAESMATLRKLLRPGTEVRTILRHVSSSGMSRRISLLVVHKGEITDITWDAARVLGYPIRGRAGYVQDVGLTVGGCGMDMGYHLVNSLSYAVHGHKSVGDAVKDNSPAGFPMSKTRPGHFRAGYSLRHRWI